jgi:catechol 2,3-dioxygenase-like lactoylglutathione lyase family enzyme
VAANLVGIHHVKYPVSDLARSRDWYERVLGLKVSIDFPDADGVVRGVGGFVDGLTVPISLQENPVAAQAASVGFDPICFSIADRAAADAWVARLNDLGVENSGIVDGTIGWRVMFHDPDGTEIRLYSLSKDDSEDKTGRPGYARLV